MNNAQLDSAPQGHDESSTKIMDGQPRQTQSTQARESLNGNDGEQSAESVVE